MRYLGFALVLGAVLVTMPLSRAAAAQGTRIALAGVPAAAAQAVDVAAPEVRWMFAYQFTSQGRAAWYRVVGRSAQGRLVLANVFADGRIRDVRVESPLGEVPRVVADWLRAGLPGFRPRRAQTIGLTLDTVVGYHFEGQMVDDGSPLVPNGGWVAINVSADGQEIVKEE